MLAECFLVVRAQPETHKTEEFALQGVWSSPGSWMTSGTQEKFSSCLYN